MSDPVRRGRRERERREAHASRRRTRSACRDAEQAGLDEHHASEIAGRHADRGEQAVLGSPLDRGEEQRRRRGDERDDQQTRVRAARTA